ncbi:MAG: sodium/proline symporter [Chloroflexi bacterium]|nr:sodium/proline symporter [Chloroflexota bacterium]
MFSPVVVVVFVAYFLALVTIAVVRARRMNAMSDYVLGGRRMSSFTSGLSASVSTTSGWTMLALPALAFTEGANILWLVGFLAVGVWLNWTLVARRLRRYTIAAEDSLTVPEFFERRFADDTGALRTVAGVLTIFFIVFYINSGLIAGANLLGSVFEIDLTPGIWITLVAVTSYTFIGGFLAVSRTDVFQAVLMLAGFIIVPVTLLVVADNPFNEVGGEPGFFNPFTHPDGELVTPVFLLGLAGWGMGAFGSQRVLQRFMAVESEAKINESRNISFAWIVGIYALSFLLGLLAHPALEAAGVVTTDPEQVYFAVADHFFPVLIGGLLLSAVIAAVMSTADSQLLLGSAVASNDLPLMRGVSASLDPREQVWLGRASLVVIGVLSGALTVAFPDSILNLVAYAWGGMGAAFGPVVVLSLYWRRFNTPGALAGLLAGFAVATLWQFGLEGGPQGMFDIMPATPGCIAGTLAAVAVTLRTAPPPEDVVATFDAVVGRAAARS